MTARGLERFPWVPSLVAVAAVALAAESGAHHFSAIVDLARGSLASVALVLICGDALAYALVPRSWRLLRGAFALALGAASSGLVLLAFGLAGVPLKVSLWVTLALGIAASVLVRRRGLQAPAERHAPAGRRGAGWLMVLVIVFLVGLLPALRTGQDTIYGENPDSMQVVGVAVLFQHAGPTETDIALPVDVVPSSWRFRYPIFYPLAAASNLSHLDPILVFPALSALLAVIAAFGFGAFAVGGLRAPPAAGAAVSAAVGLSVLTLHLVWHPYWNQLWCTAMLPYTLLFGWRAILDGGLRNWALFALTMLMLAVAYPLAVPDPLVLLAALAVAVRWRPRMPDVHGARGWALLVLVLVVLSPAVVGAAIKLTQGIGQFLSASGNLWGGDVRTFTRLGFFLGVGGGVIPAVAVCAVALACLPRLPRPQARALLAGLVLLVLVDVRFRLTPAGAYMDFKQLSFIAPVVLTLAVCFVVWLLGDVEWSRLHGVASVRRLLVSAPVLPVALLLVVGATVAALREDRRETLSSGAQVTSEMFDIRRWAALLPPGASVRVDIPPSGVQLWAIYMLGSHPVTAPQPTITDTYAHAPYGIRADYSLAIHYPLGTSPPGVRPIPPILWSVDPPLYKNPEFELRRIVLPARLQGYPATASQRLVEP